MTARGGADMKRAVHFAQPFVFRAGVLRYSAMKKK